MLLLQNQSLDSSSSSDSSDDEDASFQLHQPSQNNVSHLQYIYLYTGLQKM